MFHPQLCRLVLIATMLVPCTTRGDDTAADDPSDGVAREAELIGDFRQLTFAGRRAGEGYFSRDGRRMVFQSEREPGNPFFQIYLLDFDTGDISRVSPGVGKTTCAWIHPDGQSVLFASTHDDSGAKKKQQDELAARESGRERRYSWDYDEHFDLYSYHQPTRTYTRLTRQLGYDAEGSWSPDGKWIALASNRRAYTDSISDHDKTRFEHDPSHAIDVYIMNAGGTEPRRLTDSPGYDGGPFFSPDGQRICWRRFSEDGATAEIMTMEVDGSDQRQITRLGAMSWAPFYHPSGDYLVFTTNRHGFANFELYLVDAAGTSEPVRVTYTQGFDGLPVFSPDGTQLSWTSGRTPNKQSQIFLAGWNDTEARRLLGIGGSSRESSTVDAREAGRESAARTTDDFAPQDILRHVDYLCRPELEGRRTGTDGERFATSYVAAYFENLGLTPDGDDGGWFQPFDFTAGVALGDDGEFGWQTRKYVVNEQWRPLAFSSTGQVEPATVIFAGYGIVAPASEPHAEYDSYVHLDVADKWVVVLRYLPDGISAEDRQHLSTYSSLRFKTMVARDKGARGLIVVSGPNSRVKNQLIPLRFDGTLSGSSVPVISVTDEVVGEWLATADKDLKKLHDELDSGQPVMGFELPDVQLGATIEIRRIRQAGRNVLARLQVGDQPSDEVVVVGAHVDHLGRGVGASSLARDDEADQIHFGADDNASGVAAMLEIAQYLTQLKATGKLKGKRDIVFAAWSGEELGLLGSSHFVKNFASTTADGTQRQGQADPSTPIYPRIAACLNLDMVGRLDKRLILQGIGSSSIWEAEIERRNAPIGLPITLQNDCFIPTDASAFFVRDVPILSAFTGSHGEYHTPRDTPDRLNYDGAARIARLMALVARSLSQREAAPDFVARKGPEQARRASLRAYLGTIPDYAESEIKGLKLSGVAKDGPAEKAGVKAGDVVVELAGRRIENIYDYTYAIEALKIGETVTIVVQRGERRESLNVTPGSRE